MENTLNLLENNHPNPAAQIWYDSLVGIETQKEILLDNLSIILNKDKITTWQEKYYKKSTPLISQLLEGSSLIIFSGEVGCGKTALAQTIGTPLSEVIRKSVIVLETPSNIRGSGLVGEISHRITHTFQIAKSKIKNNQCGILIIDEADDIATSRSQNQAHHEDRAGLNVLIKQIDQLSREKVNLAVIMITNRLSVLDPAIMRRAFLTLEFYRPNDIQRKQIFIQFFPNVTQTELENLVKRSRTSIPYTYSDLIQKVGKQAIFKAFKEDKPLTPAIYAEILEKTKPSPLIEDKSFLNL